MSAPPLRKLVGAAVCVALLFVPTSLAASPSARRNDPGDRLRKCALAAINEAGAGAACGRSGSTAGLARAAAAHGRRMAQSGYFGHSRRYEGSSRPGSTGITAARSVGEAIVWSQSDLAPARAVAAWLASPVHRAVLLNRRFRHVGIAVFRVSSAPGVYRGRDATIVVADFGAP